MLSVMHCDFKRSEAYTSAFSYGAQGGVISQMQFCTVDLVSQIAVLSCGSGYAVIAPNMQHCSVPLAVGDQDAVMSTHVV